MKQLQEIVHGLAKKMGWWDEPRETGTIHMLMVSEIAEATESARKDEKPFFYVGEKPEGELVELADCVIRILDYCGSRGWDLEDAIQKKHEYNVTRSYRHGGKKY